MFCTPFLNRLSFSGKNLPGSPTGSVASSTGSPSSNLQLSPLANKESFRRVSNVQAGSTKSESPTFFGGAFLSPTPRKEEEPPSSHTFSQISYSPRSVSSRVVSPFIPLLEENPSPMKPAYLNLTEEDIPQTPSSVNKSKPFTYSQPSPYKPPIWTRKNPPPVKNPYQAYTNYLGGAMLTVGIGTIGFTIGMEKLFKDKVLNRSDYAGYLPIAAGITATCGIAYSFFRYMNPKNKWQ